MAEKRKKEILLDEAPDESTDVNTEPVEDLDTSDLEDGFKKIDKLPDSSDDEENASLEDEVAASEPSQEGIPDKEISDAANAEPQSKSATPSHLSQYQNFLQQYHDLQNQRQKSETVAGLVAAGNKIGQSMAGKFSGNFNPDMTGVGILQQQANRPVTDFEQGQIVQGRGLQLQQQTSAADPGSPQSHLVREYAAQRFPGLHITDDMSANDVALLIKSVGKPQSTHFQQLPVVNQATGQKQMAVFNPSSGQFQSLDGKPLDQTWVRDYRAQSFVDPSTGERLGFSGGTGKTTGSLTGPGVNRPGAPTATGNEPVELDRTMLTAQQAKQLDHSREKFLGEVKDDRNSLNAANRVLTVLQKGEELGADLPRELQDQLNRAFGQKGHISNEQLGNILGKPDWQDRLENAVSLASEGKLTDENRQFLYDIANVMRDQNQQFINNKAQVYSNNLLQDYKNAPNLKRAKLSTESINKLLSLDQASSFQSSTSKSKMVEVKLKDSGKPMMLPEDKVKAARDAQLIE